MEDTASTGISPARLPNVSNQTVLRLRKLLGLLQATSPSVASRAALSLFLTPSKRKIDRLDEQELVHARQHELVADGRRFSVYEWGSGPQACVLLHGWGSRAARFGTLTRPLRAQGWRVLAIDAPGHGESPGRTSSLPEFRAALEVTIAEMGPAQLLVGHSLGALAMALHLAEVPPEDATRGAVLVGMPRGAAFLLDRYIQMMDIREPTASLLHDRFVERFGQPPEAFDGVAAAARIRVPVLLIHDGEDDVVPFAHAQALSKALPRGQLLATKELGHSAMLRNRESIAAITGFTRDFHDG